MMGEVTWREGMQREVLANFLRFVCAGMRGAGEAAAMVAPHTPRERAAIHTLEFLSLNADALAAEYREHLAADQDPENTEDGTT